MAVVVLFACTTLLTGQEERAPSQDQFFSGTIVEMSSDRVTVSRTVLGRDSGTRTFQITPETRIEGKPRPNARVTVRYATAEDGDRAIHIIVRADPKKLNSIAGHPPGRAG
jgi:hypothetical protein